LAVSDQFERLRVVLVATRNPLNIGAVARAMANFGFSSLRLVNPYEPSFREAQSAVGAAHLLASAEVYASVAEAVADCSLVVGTTAAHNRELRHPLKLLPEGARIVRRRLATAPVALLFGSEKRGLSNDDLSYCDWSLHIPTQETNLSMNLGQAVAVCLYEMARDPRKAVEAEKIPPAAAGDVDRLSALLNEVLQASGFTNPGSPTAAEKTRRLVRRLKLSENDAHTLAGMLRTIKRKIPDGGTEDGADDRT
jgi:tRNA/rRNA methyltransferase